MEIFDHISSNLLVLFLSFYTYYLVCSLILKFLCFQKWINTVVFWLQPALYCFSAFLAMFPFRSTSWNTWSNFLLSNVFSINSNDSQLGRWKTLSWGWPKMMGKQIFFILGFIKVARIYFWRSYKNNFVVGVYHSMRKCIKVLQC